MFNELPAFKQVKLLPFYALPRAREDIPRLFQSRLIIYDDDTFDASIWIYTDVSCPDDIYKMVVDANVYTLYIIFRHVNMRFLILRIAKAVPLLPSRPPKSVFTKMRIIAAPVECVLASTERAIYAKGLSSAASKLNDDL